MSVLVNFESRAGTLHFKDEVLDQLAQTANVAQFVSFDPSLNQRFSRVRDFTANWRFKSIENAVDSLLQRSGDSAVNIRSFRPDEPQGSEFLLQLTNVTEVITGLQRLSNAGLHTIVNEYVDLKDGGVSGVAFGEVIEFAPGDTPRCVEGTSFASLSREIGVQILKAVYGFLPQIEYPKDLRVEFSIHPRTRGVANSHTIIWEMERMERYPGSAVTQWPNAFSRLIGDKAYGLLLGHFSGFRVPNTDVIPRAIAPFNFGRKTKSDIKWLRTAPSEPQPGLFKTIRGWTDPFKFISEQDPTHDKISSVLIQDEVKPVYSGAALTAAKGGPLIEGVRGTGEDLMMGEAGPEQIPPSVTRSAKALYNKASSLFGSARLEWVYDGKKIWLIQLQQESALSSGIIIVPGSATAYQKFEISQGIPKLRELVAYAKERQEGIEVIGKVGITSHIADTLRRARVPSRMVTPLGYAHH
jgi:hypothetical protein